MYLSYFILILVLKTVNSEHGVIIIFFVCSDHVPPAGKLQNSGTKWQRFSHPVAKIRLCDSDLNSHCAVAAKTSTAIRRDIKWSQFKCLYQ